MFCQRQAPLGSHREKNGVECGTCAFKAGRDTPACCFMCGDCYDGIPENAQIRTPCGEMFPVQMTLPGPNEPGDSLRRWANHILCQMRKSERKHGYSCLVNPERTNGVLARICAKKKVPFEFLRKVLVTTLREDHPCAGSPMPGLLDRFVNPREKLGPLANQLYLLNLPEAVEMRRVSKRRRAESIDSETSSGESEIDSGSEC